jgi:hypothetical protein
MGPPQLAAPIGRNLWRGPCVFQVEPSQQVAPNPYTRVPETPPRWESRAGFSFWRMTRRPMPGRCSLSGTRPTVRALVYSVRDGGGNVGSALCAISLLQPTRSTIGFVAA